MDNVKYYWWQKALLSSVAGLIISLILNFLLVLGLWVNVGWLKAIERNGRDFGMQFLAGFKSGHQAPLSPGYVFVDVDKTTCEKFANGTRRCELGNPLSAELIAAFVEGAKASDVGVLVINRQPFDTMQERQVVERALDIASQTWVIAPVMGRPAGPNGDMYGDCELDLIGCKTISHFRLASFVAGSDGDAGDGIIRQYPTLTKVVNGSNVRILPSAPYLASLLIGAEEKVLAQVNCLYFNIGCNASIINGTLKVASPNGRKESFANSISYSLPSLAMLEEIDPNSRQVRALAAVNYVRVLASDLLDAGQTHFKSRPDKLKGRFVVLGSSLGTALDWYSTPIGPMTGSELIINATRSYVEYRPKDGLPLQAQSLSYSDILKGKMKVVLEGFCIMTIAWFGIYYILDKCSKRKFMIRAMAICISIILFCSGIIVAGCVELMNLSAHLESGLAIGMPIDVLTPIFILGLEGYAEGMKAVLHFFEHALVLGVTGVFVLYRKLLIYFRRARMP